MIERKIIFVGGIHGVGKGTFCKNLVENFGYQHLTASEVLKWDEISDLKNKEVKNIASTQERLISNLNQIIKPNHKYLLDGHFTLLNSQGEPEKIEDVTFEEINPISIMLLTCDPETIIYRLNKRDNSAHSYNTLNKMQLMEIEHANHISQKLKIPLFEVENEDKQIIYNYLESI